MSRNLDISDLKMLEIKMLALEAQFSIPVYNEADWVKKRLTEIALGEVYREFMTAFEIENQKINKVCYSKLITSRL